MMFVVHLLDAFGIYVLLPIGFVWLLWNKRAGGAIATVGASAACLAVAELIENIG